MPDYPDLADLREELTVDDPDRRANAYGAVMSSDVAVSDVLASDPDEEVVRTLVEDDVIPDRGPGGGGRGRPASERDEAIVELLEEIRDALQTDGGGA